MQDAAEKKFIETEAEKAAGEQKEYSKRLQAIRDMLHQVLAGQILVRGPKRCVLAHDSLASTTGCLIYLLARIVAPHMVTAPFTRSGRSIRYISLD